MNQAPKNSAGHQASWSLEAIWRSLLVGDPGPALALIDALLEQDMAFAAGGFLRDLAERRNDAGDCIADEVERKVFITAVDQTLELALEGDHDAVASLLQESLSQE